MSNKFNLKFNNEKVIFLKGFSHLLTEIKLKNANIHLDFNATHSYAKSLVRWVKITTLKSQVLGANFSQLKKLGMQTPFGQAAAASNQPNSARSLEPSTLSYPAG